MKKAVLRILFSFMPILCFSQIAEGYKTLQADQKPEFKNYENLMYEASKYLMENPINPNSTEFIASTKVIDFWKNKDTGVNIPIFGKLYSDLPEKGPHRYFYMIGMINYVLTEKIENKRVLKCVKIEGQKYSEQEDVKEVQLGGAKIFLDFASNSKNGISLNPKTKKYLKAYKKNNLESVFY